MKTKLLVLLLFTSTIFFAQKRSSFSDITEVTKKITTSYFKNYIQLDFDKMKNQMNDSISFNDTTAKLIFGTKLIDGKKVVFENFKKTYAAITEMKSDIKRTIFSSNVGVFEIELTYKFKATDKKIITISKMPLIIILTVKNGKIIEHRDFGDYNIFLEQYQKQLKK